MEFRALCMVSMNLTLCFMGNSSDWSSSHLDRSRVSLFLLLSLSPSFSDFISVSLMLVDNYLMIKVPIAFGTDVFYVVLRICSCHNFNAVELTNIFLLLCLQRYIKELLCLEVISSLPYIFVLKIVGFLFVCFYLKVIKHLELIFQH